MIRLIAIILAATLAASCAAQRERLSRVGQPPELRSVSDPSDLAAGRAPVVMPMPAPREVRRNANSLWADGSRTFFGDPRARSVGDILTVEISIEDSASLSNSTSRTRSSSDDSAVNALLGLEGLPGQLLPGSVNFDPTNAINTDSSSSMSGEGDIARSESIALTVAAVIVDVMPNGNFVIAGRQEVRINHELRELSVTGVARPEDITSANTIRHTQIAEARISYGGRGTISDVQAPRPGQEVYEVLWPF